MTVSFDFCDSTTRAWHNVIRHPQERRSKEDVSCRSADMRGVSLACTVLSHDDPYTTPVVERSYNQVTCMIWWLV